MDILLMMKDTVVMRINIDEGKYDILNENLLPWETKGKWRQVPEIKDYMSKYDVTQNLVASRRNSEVLVNFLAHRVLPISRDNAKKIYNLLGLSQLQDEYSKAKVAIICRAVSLQDNYWIKNDNDKATWKDVDLRTNSLSDIVAQVSLNGSSLSLTGIPTTPELTGQGAYAKAWFRESDGLYLHKRGAKDATESRIEVMVSNLLDNCNVPHLHYELREEYGTKTCVCKCMTTDEKAILSGMDFVTYCNVNGIDPYKEALKIDSDTIYKMWIVDYLISNRDRHGLNWGFFYLCDSMKILGCHPLYDHNNAFDTALMDDDDATYVYDNRRTMQESAREAMRHVDFHFYREFTREDFITDRQYESFMRRARQLNIHVVPYDVEAVYASIPTLLRTDEPKEVQARRYLETH